MAILLTVSNMFSKGSRAYTSMSLENNKVEMIKTRQTNNVRPMLHWAVKVAVPDDSKIAILPESVTYVTRSSVL